MGVSESIIKKCLKEFKGIKRRFEVKGVSKKHITIVDDYCHHPIEIKSVLKSARIFSNTNTSYVINFLN